MDQLESCVPPGFRFHPTEEELVGYYLKRKVNSLKFDLDVIVEIDLYRMEPWDIQERCGLGYDEQNEWYFFSHKDKKYPTGTRTNRATAAGFWKATGRDKAVLSQNRMMIGMRKTLVFYRGRAPNGSKTDWIMHEYRLQSSEHAPPQEEGWVVCRAFKKPSPNHKQGLELAWNRAYYLRDNSNFSLPSSSDHVTAPMHVAYANQVRPPMFPQSPFGSELLVHDDLVEIFPQPDGSTPTLSSTTLATKGGGGIEHTSTSIATNKQYCRGEERSSESTDQGSQYVDWKNLDDFVSSQLATPAASMAAHSNFPLVLSQECELSAHDHHNHGGGGHLFTSFPDF